MAAGAICASIRAHSLGGNALERLRHFVLYSCLDLGRRWLDAGNGEKLTEAAMGSTDRKGSSIRNDDEGIVLYGWKEKKGKPERQTLGLETAVK